LGVDTSAIRSLAGQLRERAAELRLAGDGVAGRAASVLWTGRAAEAMRRAALDRAHGLRSCAEVHEAAAAALDRHAQEVDLASGLATAVEHAARSLAADATDAAARLPALTGLTGLTGLLGAP
jgi:hypothetical protein